MADIAIRLRLPERSPARISCLTDGLTIVPVTVSHWRNVSGRLTSPKWPIYFNPACYGTTQQHDLPSACAGQAA